MALGAQRADVLRLMLKQGLILAVVGVMVGLAAAFGLTRIISTLLFAVTLFASYIPALRATRFDTLVALRYE